MVVILQLIPSHAVLVYSVSLRYWTSLIWSIDTCQNKVSADRYHVNISRAHWGNMIFKSWPLTKYWFSIGSRACVRFNKLTSVFHASVLLLNMNFVITLPKYLWIHEAIARTYHKKVLKSKLAEWVFWRRGIGIQSGYRSPSSILWQDVKKT